MGATLLVNQEHKSTEIIKCRIFVKNEIICTEVEVFLDKRVREMRQTAGVSSSRGATKKRKISQTLLSINLHFSVVPRY